MIGLIAGWRGLEVAQTARLWLRLALIHIVASGLQACRRQQAAKLAGGCPA